MIHLLSGLKTSVGVQRGKGAQQGAVEYSIQSFKWKPATCAKTHKLRNSKKHLKQSPKGCKRLMGLLLAANNQATRRNEIIRSELQVGSSSNRYAPRLPQPETKSSTKQLAPTDPILGPENLLKTGFAQKGLKNPSYASARKFPTTSQVDSSRVLLIGNSCMPCSGEVRFHVGLCRPHLRPCWADIGHAGQCWASVGTVLRLS